MASFLKPVRRNAVLGNPPDPYYNNIPESANAIIKRAVEYEPNEMSNFITEMEGLITQQKKDCGAAVIKRGPCILVEEEKAWKFHQKNGSEWTSTKESKLCKILENAKPKAREWDLQRWQKMPETGSVSEFQHSLSRSWTIRVGRYTLVVA